MAGNDDRVDIEDIIYNKELVNSYMNDNLMERIESTNKGITK